MKSCCFYPIFFHKRENVSRFFIFCGLLLLFFTLLCPLAKAATKALPTSINEEGQILTSTETPWKIYADEIVSISDGVIMEGRGNVLLSNGENYLKADFVRLYTTTQWVLLQGNVVAKLGKDELEAEEAEFDLHNSTGWLREAYIFMAGANMHFHGEEIHKNLGDRYYLKKAKVTTCDSDTPAWAITAEVAEIEEDAYAVMHDSVFNVENKGLLYFPYGIVPTKTTRQTGLLRPDFGISSTHGVFYTQPLFYVIDQSRDATFYLTGMTKSGIMPSVEYRSHTRDEDKLWASFDFLYDQDQIFLDSDDDVNSSDGKVRENKERYWLRSMGNGRLGYSDWKYKFDLDYVSDQNFLNEYQNRMTGFDNSRERSYEMFGRDFAEINENRITQGYIYRDWNKFSFYTGMRYEQDPSLGHGNESKSSDDTVQTLPEAYLFVYRDRFLEGLPLEYNGFLQAGYYHREQGTKGLRTEAYPEISIPVDLRFLALDFKVGAKATWYANTSTDENSPFSDSSNSNREEQDGTGRIVPDFSATAYTQASRVWNYNPIPLEAKEENLGEYKVTGLRHLMQPRARYTWRDDVNQEDNPFYFTNDRLQEESNLELVLQNLFTLRRDSVIQTESGPQIKTDYIDLVRFDIKTGYDFREQDRVLYTEQYESRPWHDLQTDLDLRIFSWLDLELDTYYSFYDTRINRADLGFTATAENYGSLSTSYSMRDENYDYRRYVNYRNFDDIIPTENVDVIENTLRLNFAPNLGLYWEETTNLASGESYEREIGLSYLHQCFKITGIYTKDTIEETFGLNIEFLGLGF